jgi:hypothetical protein
MNILDPTLISHVVSTIFASDPPSQQSEQFMAKGPTYQFPRQC